MADTRPWGDAHPGSDLGLGDAETAAHLGEPEGALLGAQLLDPGGDGGLVGRIGVELGEELIAGVVVELAPAHRMFLLFQVVLVTLLGQREAWNKRNIR